MKADVIIAEIARIVQDITYTEDDIVGYINRGQLALANTLFLPWLADGSATVTTDATTDVLMPSDFHKNIYSASADQNGQNQLAVFTALNALIDEFGVLQTEPTGPVRAVCHHAGRLFYQNVPAEPVGINLRYYRRPTVLTDSSDTDWNNDDFDNAVIAYACWHIFEMMEDGIEGDKINTSYHQGKFRYYEDILSLFSYREGRNFATNKPSVTKVWV